MKILLLSLATIFLLISCEKDTSKAFLTGKLVSDCDNTPVANTTIYFYQNYQAAPNWESDPVQQLLLETVRTNADGSFFIWGSDYTDNNTNAIQSASIRLEDNTIIANGVLGEGEGHKEGELSNSDVGEIFNSGMDADFNLNVPSHDANVQYDSIIIYLNNYQTSITSVDSSNGYYNFQVNNMNVNVKSFTDTENKGKYLLDVYIYYYYNGGNSYNNSEEIYLSQCDNGEDIYINF